METRFSDILILASASPRRKELLELAGIPFEIVPAQVDESCDGTAAERVQLLSVRKAREVASRFPGRFVLAADTLVEYEEAVLGKPSGEKEALRMLHLLSGKTHQVYSGVALISPDGNLYSAMDRSDVTFDTVSEPEIRSYVLSGEPLDKAGAYAVQGRASLWISHLNGNYSSVIGLPMNLVRSLLIRAGYDWK